MIDPTRNLPRSHDTEVTLRLGDLTVLLTPPDASADVVVTVELVEEAVQPQPPAQGQRRGSPACRSPVGGPEPTCPVEAFRGPPGCAAARRRYTLSFQVTSKGLPEAPATVAVVAAARAEERAAANPTPPGGADVPEIVTLLLDFFAGEGDPPVLSVARIADRLGEVDPATWGRWDGRTDRLAMVGRAIRGQLKAAGLDVASGRMDGVAGRPAGYRLADIRKALS
jgi:hypothetical protein